MSPVFCVKDPVYNIFLDLYPCSPFLKAEHRRGRGTGWRRCWQGSCGDDRAPRGRAGKACRGSARDSSGTGAFRRLQAAGRPAPTTAGGGAKGQRGCCDADHGWRGAVAVATAGEGSSLAPADMAREQTTVRQPLGRAAWLGEREKRGSTPGRGRSRLGRLGFGHGGRC